ncbi:Jnm1p NDAI_0C03640 [Naumovozyma dairenensis CBS 421]|uniref:Dynactin subunit 2 n=1 Tax=Naumovozyma dairenensis (strain ATCC 10597 / BCRC 20456 / CBS 421 / NBRC 0211 / NRRL Y-12639) TaxID=1071378 RepID=G0W8B3_NAUDC|nr:hypothetical protein NDAI_0C03640 [Naumovozyma dairenensis CBS 421]CCD24024.1 hypothetical protein NDAI_0C03640 [Naumovozyma dairenensis CBS 421]
MEVFDFTDNVEDVSYEFMSALDDTQPKIFESEGTELLPENGLQNEYRSTNDTLELYPSNDIDHQGEKSTIIYENTPDMMKVAEQLESQLKKYNATKSTKEDLRKMQIDKPEISTLKKELDKISLQELDDMKRESTMEDKLLFEKIQKSMQSDEKTLLKGLHDKLSEHVSEESNHDNNNNNNDKYILKLPNIEFNSTELYRILNLEERIHKLESSLGHIKDEPNICQSSFEEPIMTQLNKIYRQLILIENNEPVLNNFQKSLTEINKKYEDSLLGKNINKNNDLQELAINNIVNQKTKIDNLYKFYDENKHYADILPKLSERMKLFKKVNMKVSESFQMLQNIDRMIADVASTTEEWNCTINKIVEKISSQEIIVNKNFEKLNDKIQNLEAKLETLTRDKEAFE